MFDMFSPRRARREAKKTKKSEAEELRDALFDDLLSGDAGLQAAALSRLADQLDVVHGDQAMELGQATRASGALREIVRLISHPAPSIHQTALYVLGNLASDAVDAESWRTKLIVKEEGGFVRVLEYVWSDEIDTLFNALGAVQNLCSYPEYVAMMEARGVDERLEQLMDASIDPGLAQYAEGCLRNMSAVREHAEAKRVDLDAVTLEEGTDDGEMRPQPSAAELRRSSGSNRDSAGEPAPGRAMASWDEAPVDPSLDC